MELGKSQQPSRPLRKKRAILSGIRVERAERGGPGELDWLENLGEAELRAVIAGEITAPAEVPSPAVDETRQAGRNLIETFCGCAAIDPALQFSGSDLALFNAWLTYIADRDPWVG